MALAGRATAEGTARFAASRAGDAQASTEKRVYRQALGWTLSSIGYGTSLGDITDAVDGQYQLIVAEAVRSGCNVFDTAVSYRAQRSEVALGRALASVVASGQARRDELVLCSKGGFIPYRLDKPVDPGQYVYDTFIKTGIAEPDDLAGGIHCMAPGFLGQQIMASLRNLDVRALDIYYIQNPETQLSFVDRTTFRRRLQLAFARLEEEVAAGRIGCYGLATWEGFRRAPMSPGYIGLETLLSLVTEVAGAQHHLRVIQLPVSPAMTEAIALRNQPVRNSILPFLVAAKELGIAVVASACPGQGQIPARFADAMAEQYPEIAGVQLRALQFVRGLPGVVTALFGSLDPGHVRDNLAMLRQAADPARALRLADSRGR